MSVEVFCECGRGFVVGEELVGGLANCPACGRAVEVPGLRDPFWVFLQGLGAVAWAVGVAVAYVTAGLLAAVVTAVALAALLWLFSRAL